VSRVISPPNIYGSPISSKSKALDRETNGQNTTLNAASGEGGGALDPRQRLVK